MRKLLYLILQFIFMGCMAQEGYVQVDGMKFHTRELGKGNITVIFESGMSDSLEVWGSIPDSIALDAHVFLYDRADIGKSGASVSERTIPNVVGELRSLLDALEIHPPYVLVGHSLGGLITRYFAARYPEEVKALLLLDPAPESYWNRMSERELKKYIKGGNKWYEKNFPEKYRREWYSFIPNLEYMKNLENESRTPLILVSASAWKWYPYHEEIAKGFIYSKHLQLEGQHHIYKDHPDLITGYIRELLKQ